MQQYIIRRLLLNVVVIWLVATMIFLALRIDSDHVVKTRAGSCASGEALTQPELYEECLAITKAELGLDKSVPEQYAEYMGKLARLDLGNATFGNKDPISKEIGDRVGASVELGLLQIAVALIVALPVGILSAIRQDTWIDYVLRFFSIALLGIPVFVVAILSILLLHQYGADTFLFDWLTPQAEYKSLTDDPMQNAKNMLAPALVGGFGTGAVMMRFLRSQMLEVLRQDYVRTAWAKGLKERVVIVRHALKNALIPVLTIVGILLGSVVSANVVLEFIYRIPGIGNYIVFTASQSPDFNAVQGVVITVAVSLVFINLMIDVFYGWLDPRIRYS
jgi:peptide/nickel transport system permease protein